MYKNINKAEINFSNFQALKVSHFKLHHEKNAEYCLFIQIKLHTLGPSMSLPNNSKLQILGNCQKMVKKWSKNLSKKS